MPSQDTDPVPHQAAQKDHAALSPRPSTPRPGAPSDRLSIGQRTLLNNLTRELFQTETSALRHATREAARLGETAPARALRAVAADAKSVLAQLPALAERNDMITSKGAMLVGELFSQTRDKLADMLIDAERSYRGTLLGMRHGVDVVRSLQELASATGKTDLHQFCDRWLQTRKPLVQTVEDELGWFAQHADEAAKRARTLFGRRRRAAVRTEINDSLGVKS